MSEDKWKKTFDMLIALLFEAKGLTPPKPEEYKNLPDKWYTQHAWTEAEHEAFNCKAAALLKKRHGLSAEGARKELSWFNLMYGWKREDLV